MPAGTSRLAVVVVGALLVAGCAGKAADPTAAAPGTSTASTTTPAPTTTTVPPLTAEEDAWLEAFGKLRERAEKVVIDSPTNLTAAAMGALATRMRRCSRELARLGAPTAPLQPVYKLAKQGCAQSDKGAKCFATAAGIGDTITSFAEERKMTQSVECGIAAGARSVELLGRASVKGFEISEKAAHG
ncbi:MAG TPA: hypothetical protein VFU54_19285 [Actinomycetota bacterium]|nr:hypothetical protein [Actinomycetota bacterium]